MAKRNWHLAVFILGLSLLVAFLDYQRKIDFITFPLRRLFLPIQDLSNFVGEKLTSPVRFVRFIHSGENRILYLEEKNRYLTSLVGEVERFRAENEALKAQLGVSLNQQKPRLIPGRVLGLNRYLQMTVEGSFGLVADGQSVVSGDSYIGKVVKSGSGIVYVLLSTDPESKIPAKTVSATGIVTGEFSSRLVLDKVNKSEAIAVGDLVYTSGLDAVTAPDLILGKVEKILLTESSLFQQAFLVPLSDARKLKHVFVIIK